MKDSQKNIFVTKTFLPPLDDYIEYLRGIWHSNQLTNNGSLLQELESKLKDFLGVKHCLIVNNGTIALQIAMKVLNLHGDIITTPFSFVATTSSIVWEGYNPVYVDIDPLTLGINSNLIEEAITSKTSAILATHVYGYPCNVEHIQKIASKYGLKVIYDAAHAFGVRYKGFSLLTYGNISTLSFHATKLFHTVEGGAIVTNDDELAHRISYIRNFGFRNQESFWGLGINAKNSELHAAMGLCILPNVKEIIRSRKNIFKIYYGHLRETEITRFKILDGTEYNYAYYPVLFPTEEILIRVLEALNRKRIYPRRYFYPTLNKLSYINPKDMPIAEDISRRVLCLPLHYELNEEVIALICNTIKQAI